MKAYSGQCNVNHQHAFVHLNCLYHPALVPTDVASICLISTPLRLRNRSCMNRFHNIAATNVATNYLPLHCVIVITTIVKRAGRLLGETTINKHETNALVRHKQTA
jgi:hypothetical protein